MTFRTLKSHLAVWLCVTLILGMTLPSCAKEPQFETARLSIEPDKADFGTIQANDPIAFHDVSHVVRNLGGKPLTVDDIELPAGFSYVMIPRKVIEGGKKATLKITMDTRKFSGQVSETAHLLSNDPSQPRIAIKLEATIVGKPTDQRFEIVNEPDISFEHKVIDFGAIGRNKLIEHRFPFKNLGGKPLKIHSVETKCICVSGVPTMWEIPPRGSAAIVARLEPYKYEGREPWKSLSIATNDPDEPVIQLTVSAKIVDEAVLEPESVLFPSIQSGQQASAEVKLVQEGAKELLIKSIKTSSPQISVTTSPLEGEQKGYLLEVTVAPDIQEGKFEEVVTIFTNYRNYSWHRSRTGEPEKIYKNYSRLKLPVKGSVTRAISVSPQKINFGSSAPGKPVQRKLIISSQTSSFDIESLSLTDPGFRVSHSPIELGKKYEITVEFIPGQPERQIEDELVITAAGARLVVPIFAAVKLDS